MLSCFIYMFTSQITLLHIGAGDQSELLEHATGAVGMPMMSLQKTLALVSCESVMQKYEQNMKRIEYLCIGFILALINI